MGTSRIGGTLIPPGSRSRTQSGSKTFTPAAVYPSKSNPNTTYTVCEVSDDTTSCDCMGWTRRNPPTGRTCRHTEDYQLYLRADWQMMQGGAAPAQPRPVQRPRVAEPVAAKQAPGRERGGSLADLIHKLDSGEI